MVIVNSVYLQFFVHSNLSLSGQGEVLDSENVSFSE